MMLLRLGSLCAAALAAALISAAAHAGPIECTPATCGWTIEVDGVELRNGQLAIDADGNVTLMGDTSVSGTGFTASIDSFSGNVDPEIVFGLGATNSSDAIKTFAFTFTLPLGGFNFGNGIITEATLGTTLTASSIADGTVFPILGVNKIVDSQDIQLDPFANIDKGVDIGDALTDPAGGGPTLRSEIENGFIAPGFSFDLMSVTVAFGLADTNQQVGLPGQVGVGFSGSVLQVPEPGTALLLGLGLLAMGRRRRRR